MSVVLLVLERIDDREAGRAFLRDGGYVVREVGGASEAMETVAAEPPMALVVAADLAGEGCLALCRSLRAERRTATLPVLVLATGDDDPAVLSALKAGADDYIVRGTVPEAALRRLRRLIRNRQLGVSAVLNEQLAQVGRLLTGIIHEIRGPLSVVRGQAELLRMTLDASSELLRHVEPILRNAQLMQSRLDHLMATVRGGPPLFEAVDINGLVSEATDLFLKGSDPRRHRIAITNELAEGLPPASADAGRVIQVLINLLCNAREAILAADRPGRIRLRTALAREQDRPWIVVTVDDDGPGIDEPNLDRIFEPYFTTKPEGSGYGLYLSSEILHEHGGRLAASRSDLGGAGFAVWLPLDPPAAPPDAS